MEMLAKTEGNIRIISVLDKRIDAPAAVLFKETMRNLTQNAPREVVLDLSEVVFIDSSGLGAIVAIMKTLSPDHRFTLAGLTPAVEKVFRLTRMDTVFRIFMTIEEALDAEWS